MSEDLYRYYESELTFIRQLAGEFAKKYPKVASRLEIRDENKESSDPHVERLIQSFALLAGRIRHKIDDEFPEIVESLLDLLYPHYLRPIPPFAIAQFQFDPVQARATEPAVIAAGSELHSRPSGGIACTFRTAYPVTVWPIQLTATTLGSASAANLGDVPQDTSAVMRIQCQTQGALTLGQLPLSTLRFFLNGEGSPVHTLYELLLTQSIQVQVRSRGQGATPFTVTLPADAIRPVGFGMNEGVLPYADRSFPGYRLLQEYFYCPSKFLFVDIAGFDAVSLSDIGSTFDILIFFRDSELRERIPAAAQAVRGELLQLGCTPIVNLFERNAEPIRLTHSTTEYLLEPDRHRQSATEVYSVDRVTSSAAFGEEPKVYEPFYSLQHSYGERDSDRCYWHARRRASVRAGDSGTDIYLSLVDLSFDPKLPATDVMSVHVTCTNRDFVSRLRWQKEWGELEGEGLALVQARCAVAPTPTRRPPLRGSLEWRLISHLSLNHLSITGQKGREALQEILSLYAFGDDEDILNRVRGITDVGSESAVSRVNFDSGIAFCRGLDIALEFDEDQFAGSGAFLMGSVLDRFFGLYGAINSFTRLTATSRQRRNPVFRWPARAGERRLV